MTAPKFGKVELLIRIPKKYLRLKHITFENCGLMISGDYIIVIIDEQDEINETITSTGKIFNLSEVIAYKTHIQ